MKDRRTNDRRMGRPTIPDADRKSVVLSFVATEEEADTICKNAIRENISVSQYLRTKLGTALLSL